MSGGGNLEIDDTLYVVTYNLEKADAFITAAERLIGPPRSSIRGYGRKRRARRGQPRLRP